ncbi:MAG: tRNA (guanosine(37)-N1)-methyltransferase TrmD [Candidatus Marinimicrobia bacterium]|nr:tRNA (guanosine(37)-N1)-methyltransferase TrmD [Candidatus Neomarinimicrobiota bacterium]MBL7023266.1 tRNA (guanosine(37)-N1)-methyltransferase TrmD [Candidatus Neomarinimicrobiota bacterium]MBL7108860.1 tRNA (guanosine(37)-N1)-methyltransferase TrmD [Candidatus Neomarinimicrobiota bacterium]
MVEAVVDESILGRANAKSFVNYLIYDLFNFADPPHYRIDDYPFGGGSGMIMKPEPVFRAYKKAVGDQQNSSLRVIFPTPDGEVLTHKKALELSKCSELMFINGHYKGIDQRIRDVLVTDEISIGDYVLTGGELPTLVILDAIIRLIPGVLNTYESAETDSFASGLLDGPHFTRPEEFEGMKVPEVLLSGHHKKIADWKLDQQKEKTKLRRTDLFRKYLELKSVEKENGENNG